MKPHIGNEVNSLFISSYFPVRSEINVKYILIDTSYLNCGCRMMKVKNDLRSKFLQFKYE